MAHPTLSKQSKRRAGPSKTFNVSTLTAIKPSTLVQTQKTPDYQRRLYDIAAIRPLRLGHNRRSIRIRQDHQPCQLHLWHRQLHGNTVPGDHGYTYDHGVIQLRAANPEELDRAVAISLVIKNRPASYSSPMDQDRIACQQGVLGCRSST